MAEVKGVFTSFDNFIDGLAVEFVNEIQMILSSNISSLLVASIALFLVFYGYMVLAGKIEAPVPDLVWTLAKFALLIMFIQNAGGILSDTHEAIKGLTTLGLDPASQSGFGFIDDQMVKIKTISTEAGDKAPWGSGWLISAAIWAGFILSAFPAAVIIIRCKFTLFFLLGFSPLFIFCLMWGWLKRSFSNFVSEILSNVLTVIVITTIYTRLINYFFERLEYNGENAFMFAATLILMGLFNTGLVAYVYIKTASLMNVSIEKVPASAGMLNNGLQKGVNKIISYARKK